MQVEACCQTLLKKMLLKVDRNRLGWTIDIGVGTFAFYFKIFSQLGFNTVAVEPLPTDLVRQLCSEYKVRLFESCVSDVDGFVNLYIGNDERDRENYNLNSMRSGWWGGSNAIKEVPSISLQSLLSEAGIQNITCLKIDVEGMELAIIRQLAAVRPDALPKMLMFEYGWGKTPEGQAILNETIESLEIIQSLGYKQAIVVDSQSNDKVQLLDLKSSLLRSEYILPLFSEYGNLIVLREPCCTQKEIDAISKRYSSGRVAEKWLDRLLQRVKSKLGM